ncbi:MAG: exodeoxyribonuclease III [Clostridium sp.]|nr:exodeoxyribonuclease III [Clostridium sp.]
MRYLSWNVNGIRACVTKGFLDVVKDLDPDVIGLQETKVSAGQISLELPGYHQYWNYAQKKGYSGTALFTKEKPIEVTYGMGVEEHDTQGRVICAQFTDFFFVTVYTPNSKEDLAALPYRMTWEASFAAYLQKLETIKPVIVCGDLNVAHQEIDLKNPKSNRRSAGFTDEERSCFRALLAQGYIDTFRYFYPDLPGVYSWWSYRANARTRNIGWRIDYFLTSQVLQNRLLGATIHTGILGSDHCPVELTLL